MNSCQYFRRIRYVTVGTYLANVCSKWCPSTTKQQLAYYYYTIYNISESHACIYHTSVQVLTYTIARTSSVHTMVMHEPKVCVLCN